jgi:hypothetical protein
MTMVLIPTMSSPLRETLLHLPSFPVAVEEVVAVEEAVEVEAVAAAAVPQLSQSPL